MIKVLDSGYVKFIEAWGHGVSGESKREDDAGFTDFECGIVEAARQSTQGSFRGWDQDERLLRFLFLNNPKHCYDKNTEVLVQGKGFIKWSEVVNTDKLGQWDKQIDSLVFERPQKLIRQKFEGEMYRVEHSGVDLLVTNNHQMLVKLKVRVNKGSPDSYQDWAEEWSLVKAAELGHRSMVRYRKHAVNRVGSTVDLSLFPEHEDSKALLQLIGFFVGDGFAPRDGGNVIRFHLRKSRKIAYLIEVCSKIGWSLIETTKENFAVKAPGIGRLFRDQFYCSQDKKRIPQDLQELNVEEAKSILDGLRNSDGCQKRSTWVYATTSEQVAEAVQLLALMAGEAAQINQPTEDGCYRVAILARMREPVINQITKNTSNEFYKGEIFCAETRTGVLIVRRNGKIVLSGNSTPFEFAGMTIEVQAPILCFREWHRHRTQSYNEMSARYSPVPDNHYMPTVERCMMGKGDKNKQAQAVAGSMELTGLTAQEWLFQLNNLYELSQAVYQNGLDIGIPKEVARCAMTVSRYSRMRATANLRNWLAFATLRMHPDAQWEIRQFANVVGNIIGEKFPRTWALFNEEKGSKLRLLESAELGQRFLDQQSPEGK